MIYFQNKPIEPSPCLTASCIKGLLQPHSKGRNKILMAETRFLELIIPVN